MRRMNGVFIHEIRFDDMSDQIGDAIVLEIRPHAKEPLFHVIKGLQNIRPIECVDAVGQGKAGRKRLKIAGHKGLARLF